MDKNEYKVVSDNLGEYSVLTKDNVLVVTEIQDHITAETFCDALNELNNDNRELKKDHELFFGQVFDILLKYQDLFNREMADEVLEELGIELTRWFE